MVSSSRTISSGASLKLPIAKVLRKSVVAVGTLSAADTTIAFAIWAERRVFLGILSSRGVQDHIIHEAERVPKCLPFFCPKSLNLLGRLQQF